jgi:hypothetical protein
MKISLKYSDQTLGTYIDFMAAENDTVGQLAAITGLKREQLRNLPMEKVEQVIASYAHNLKKDEHIFKQFIELDGIKFGFHPNLKAITFGEWLDAMEYSKNFNKNIDKILAILYRPVTAELNDRYTIEPYDADIHSKYASKMRQLPLPVVNGCMLFFSTLLNDLMSNSPEYLEEIVRELQMKMEEIQSEAKR